MAKIYASRIAQKLGISEDDVSGENYRDIMSEVIEQNTRNIQRSVNRLTNSSYEKQLVNIRKKGRGKEKIVLLPDVEEVLPKRSVSVVKSAESGRLITQTLADRANKSLRETLKTWQQSGRPWEISTGRNAGKIDPNLIREFEKSIRGTFQSYTKVDPSIGVPGNVKQIAITEIRSNIDAVKSSYHKELERKNSGTITVTKTWRQNKSLSKTPRENHKVMNGVTIPRGDLFKVPNPNGGFDLMDHPHAAGAPAEQVIGCNCDAVYKAVLL